LSSLYDRIELLCKKMGVNITTMCREAKVTRGNLSDLKMGRTNSLSAKNLGKISTYFGTSIEYLLTGEHKGNAPAENGKSEIEFDDFMYAMQDESKGLTEEDKALLLSMARQLNTARDKKNGGAD